MIVHLALNLNMHTTHAMPHLHCDTHVMHFYFVFCLCIVTLVSLFRLVSSVLCRCTPIVCASMITNKNFLMFIVFFLGVLSLFVCSLVSVGLYALLLVHNVHVSACTSMHFHVTTSTYLGLVVAMLQHLPLYSPRVYNSRIISLIMIVVEFISRVIYFYAFEFTADIALWVKNLTYKQTMRFVGCIAFGLVCAFGMGLPLLFGFIYIPVSFKLLNDIIYILGGGGGEQQGGVATILSQNITQNKRVMSGGEKQTKRSNKSGKENCSLGENEPPPKRKCKSVGDKHTCGPCTVWIQTGSVPEQLRHHNMRSRIRHPGDKAFQYTLYLSCNKTYNNISLRSDSCLCNACYMDCERATGKPRWLGLSKYYILKHCILCCQGMSECTCNIIKEWGPEKWYDCDSEFQQWCDYFKNSGYTVVAGESCMGYNLCKSHYVNMRAVHRNRVCVLCKEGSTTTNWTIGQKLLELLGPLKDDYDLAPNDWVCSKCYKEVGFPKSGNNKSRFSQIRNEVFENTIKIIDRDGACLIKDIVNNYKSILENNHTCIKDGEYDSFKKFLKSQLKDKGYELYSPTKTAGSMCYNPLVFPNTCLHHVHSFISNQESNISERVRAMVKRQTKLFPTSIKFDYRQLFDTTKNKGDLEKYFNNDLLMFVKDVTCSDRFTEKRKNISDKYVHSRNIKCMMVCAIMANMMDTRSCFLQTLIGLACYAQGLRDKGMKLLNCFGITSSVSHIREHGSWWAKIRKAINDIDVKSFWRVTFDNLDFRMRFAKKISAGGGQLKRMLHLLTSQVSFRQTSPHKATNNSSSTPSSITANRTPPTGDTTPSTCTAGLNTSSASTGTQKITENNFRLEHENSEWVKFSNSVYTVSSTNIMDDVSFDNSKEPPLLDKLQNFMPYWTPTVPDKVVYTTVDEAHSGSVQDVGKFLSKLKQDLCIGKEGFPSYVILGGDQQTYAHMKNLKSKYSDHYEWMYPVPGDWHIMKTSAEVLKHILADGGFKIFAKQCGHKGDVTQWQDIHNILAACHESLIRAAVIEYSKLGNDGRSDKFWEWINDSSKQNTNETKKFWSQLLIYLHAYTGFYFSIRSGNWLLRNSCLKVLTELFFAYSRDKYEVLSINALGDSFKYPKEVVDYFMNGQWTVSAKGRPFHNLALDEAHECIINRKLKQITTRASHFRMVELSDFMAYLDEVLTGLEAHVFREHKCKTQNKKKDCTRAKLIYRLISNKSPFSHTHDGKPLCNIFTDNPPPLAATNREDLLQIQSKGSERMFSYIRQYALEPPTEIKQKRRRQKLKTFTIPNKTSKKLNSKLNQATLLLSKAYQSLLNPSSGHKQTFPLPLALCTPDGQMRKCNKSDFKDVIYKLFQNTPYQVMTTQCPLINNEHELIVDFLFLLHQPPPPDIHTFSSYAQYLWDKIIWKLGVQRGANVVRVVVDKSQYLPKPRELLHQFRSSNTGKMDSHDCNICDEGEVPHATSFQQMLANVQLKRQLINYLMQKFINITSSKNMAVQVIFDYEGISTPCSVYNGTMVDLPMLANKNGEADYNVWFHCMTSSSRNIVVLGSDTDIWVYGMIFVEGGWFPNKTVYVERGIQTEYVSLNTLHTAASYHPQLKRMHNPLSTLAAIYILTGGDYISSFFRTSKQAFVTVFLDNIEHICNDDPLILTTNEQIMGIEGQKISAINTDTWIKLVCCVYLNKHKTLFNSEKISLLHASLQTAPIPDEKKQLLQWLAYTTIAPLNTLARWHDFTRRVCFHHSRGSKDHECLLVPSLGALKYHKLRAEYVLKVSFLFNSNYVSIEGWKMVNNCIEIIWDEEEVIQCMAVGKGCGCKGIKCDGSTAGCLNCFRSCKPCTLKCKCKMRCNNPHNNGGKCKKCDIVEESEEESEASDNEQSEETVPVINPINDRNIVETDTDTDDTESDNDA